MPERHRILIVDDDAVDRQAVVLALRRDSAQIDDVDADVLEVDTVAQAREAIQNEEFTCVFLAHSLPDGTALDLLVELRGLGMATPVVVLTGQRDEETLAEVMKAGAVDYLPKERLHPDLIARSLRAALRFHQSQQEKQAVLDELRARDRAIAAATNGIAIADARQPDCPLVYVNGAFLHMTGYSEAEVIGRNCRFLQGPETDPDAVRQLRDAVREQRGCQILILNYRKDETHFWNEVTVSPVRNAKGILTHFIGIQTDVTARHMAEGEREATQQALQRSQEDLRFAIDGARLGTFYCDFPLDKIAWNQTCKEHFFLPPDAEVDIALFYSLLHPDDREPTRHAIEHALAERVRYDVAYRTLAPDGRTRWVNAVGRFYYGADGNPIRFDGITIDISARKAAEEESLRRAEREALLSRIGLALRALPDPAQVLETAVRELGEAVGADRCHYTSYDQVADTATVGPDWHREGLPSLAGLYLMSGYAVNRDPLFVSGKTQVVIDTSADRSLQELGVHALVRVPLISGASMTALSVIMTGGPREWTADEVALVEAVATQTQGALDSVRVQRREHNIAEQLQAALQPPLPEGVTGLTLAKYYEAALDEAGVGGDFYDVFPIEKGRTVLALGDLSGKGLAAAAQVSIVRNMLRAFLYSKPSLSQAATDLNRVIALNDLLSGFATLWVGCYDGATGELAYVNMGQEPALLRRAATGEIEQLLPTGPVLGADGNASYGERTVPLSPGDALAVFTDGITECGPSRREMLGIEGVSALLRRPFAREDTESARQMASSVVLRLVEGVDTASQGGVARDDVCILVAVAEGTRATLPQTRAL